jgi:hypothetical protein
MTASRRAPASLARGAALLALGALALHQLRYLLAFGPASGEALQREGHGYLGQALPVLVALAAATIAATLLAAALGGAGAPRRSGPGRGLLYASALFAVFGAQELTEGALAPGHPAGLAGLVGGGAWVAAPLALLLGCATALVERLLDRAGVALALAGDRRMRPGRAAEPARPALPAPRVPLAALPLAFGIARRPPPAASIA